ncbi:MAG TPA: bacteriophage holin [Pseudonocardiaceae bacterium]
MPYLLSVLLAAVGLLVLAVLVVRVLLALRRFTAAYAQLAAKTGDETGLLRARTAALRVAMAERRSVDDDTASPRTIG